MVVAVIIRKSHRTVRSVALSNFAVDGLTPSRIREFFADLQICGLRMNHRLHFAQWGDPQQREAAAEHRPDDVAECEAGVPELRGVCL